MKKIIFIIVLFFNILLYGQNQKIQEDSIINIVKTDLQNKGVKNYIIYKVFTGDQYIQADETVDSELLDYYKIYYLWEQDKKYFVKKTDNLNMFSEIEIAAGKTFKFIYDNISKIESEKIRPSQVMYDGKLIEINSSDYGYYSINLNINDNIITKKIQSIDVNYTDNYNFKYNNNLKIVKLKNMLNEIIIKLENEKLFIIQD